MRRKSLLVWLTGSEFGRRFIIAKATKPPLGWPLHVSGLSRPRPPRWMVLSGNRTIAHAEVTPPSVRCAARRAARSPRIRADLVRLVSGARAGPPL